MGLGRDKNIITAGKARIPDITKGIFSIMLCNIITTNLQQLKCKKIKISTSYFTKLFTEASTSQEKEKSGVPDTYKNFQM